MEQLLSIVINVTMTSLITSLLSISPYWELTLRRRLRLRRLLLRWILRQTWTSLYLRCLKRARLWCLFSERVSRAWKTLEIRATWTLSYKCFLIFPRSETTILKMRSPTWTRAQFEPQTVCSARFPSLSLVCSQESTLRKRLPKKCLFKAKKSKLEKLLTSSIKRVSDPLSLKLSSERVIKSLQPDNSRMPVSTSLIFSRSSF